MSKRAIVKPDWLDRMLCRWGVQRVANLGYAGVSPMFKERTGQSAQALDPTGYSREDFRELEAAIDLLPPQQQAAVIRAYRPWTAPTMEDKFPCTSPTTWHRWLTSAAATLALKLQIEAAPIDKREPM